MQLQNISGIFQEVNGERVAPLRNVDVADGFKYNPEAFIEVKEEAVKPAKTAPKKQEE